MNTLIDKVELYKFLAVSLISISIVMLFANFLSAENRTLVTDLLFVVVPASVVVLSIMIMLRFKASGMHGKAWIVFAIFATTWFVAEQLWVIYELILKIDPWPSAADFFYLGGYPLLFAFSILYIYPVRKAISRKIVVFSSSVSALLLVCTYYFINPSDSSANIFEVFLAASYPVLDAIVLCPALIGVILFFKAEVSLLWSLLCIAVALNVVADTGFLILTESDSYFTGHPIDLFYLWAYILFAFGVYSHIRIFQSRIDGPYENASDLR